MLALLASVLFFQQADVVMFSMMSEAIRAEYRFSDTQMGMLNGSALALFYACAAIPLARIADRGWRRNVIAISLALWSVCTALTAFADSFESFFLIRLVTGVGEAGAMPAAFSLIAARFPQSKRAGATSLVQSGRFMGMVAGLTGAGWLLSMMGWRHIFLIFGVPGILLAVIFCAAVREPKDVGGGPAASVLTVFRAMNRKIFVHLFALVATASMISFGMLAWAPAFYQRSFHMTSGEVGVWLGVALGLGNVAGTLLGGYLTNRFANGSLEGGLRISFWGFVINFPLAIMVFWVPDKAWSIALMLVSSVSGALCVGPVYATIQTLTPPRFRATAVALFQSGVVLIAIGCGPLLVGAISDAAEALAGRESLRWSLIIVTSCGIWPLYHGWRVLQLCPSELSVSAKEPEAQAMPA